MKKIFFMGVMGMFLLGSCSSHSGHNQEGHDHEGHNHATEEHAHNHEGHSHESHEGHNHAEEAHNHDAHAHEGVCKRCCSELTETDYFSDKERILGIIFCLSDIHTSESIGLYRINHIDGKSL